MFTREYCFEQAEICEEYAAQSTDPRLRKEWLETAAGWRDAAGPAEEPQEFWLRRMDLAS